MAQLTDHAPAGKEQEPEQGATDETVSEWQTWPSSLRIKLRDDIHDLGAAQQLRMASKVDLSRHHNS